MEQRMKRVFGLIVVGCLIELLAPGPCWGALKVHMLSGSEEYRSEQSLSLWAAHLKEEYAVVSTVSLGTDRSTKVAGLEKLKNADVLVVFCRRWKLSESQGNAIVEYIDRGKPVLGIRTASHAFEFFKEFDKEVLGGDYSGHWKDGQPMRIILSEHQAEHPILQNVAGWERVGKPYKNRSIAVDSQLLLHTKLHGEQVPLAWARTLNNKQRVFYTSLGIPGDFRNESFIRLLDNALFWVGNVEQSPAWKEPSKND
jgi:type 1 glutamine amidotransferase